MGNIKSETLKSSQSGAPLQKDFERMKNNLEKLCNRNYEQLDIYYFYSDNL